MRNVASVANVLEPRFNLLFFKYSCSVNRLFVSADFCWTHGCRLYAYKVVLVKLLVIFLFISCVCSFGSVMLAHNFSFCADEFGV